MKIKEKTISSNRITFPIMFVIFSILLEMINFLYIGFRSSKGNIMILPSYFLFDLGIMLMIAGLIYVVQNKHAVQALFYLFLSIQVLLNVINSTMYSVFGDILSFDLFALGGEATTAIEADFIDWGGLVLNFSVFAIMITLGVCMQVYNKKTITIKNFSFPVVVLAVFILCQSAGLGMFQISKSTLSSASTSDTEIQTSDEYLWENFQFKIDSFKKFGVYGFYVKSIINLISGDDIDEYQTEHYIEYIDDGYKPGDSSAPLYGDNLIVILCESLDWYAIDPYNTPTLYSMASGNDSVVFTEYYSRNRTNNSEGIVLNGNMPRNVSLEDAFDNGNKFEYALPHVFKAANDGKDTVASYFHQNTSNFYGRDKTHDEGLGFDNLYFIDSYTGEQERGKWGQWISDLDFTKNLMDQFIPDSERFLTFFATMSTHGPYTYDNPYLAEYYTEYDENFELFSEWLTNETDFILPETEIELDHLKHYKAGAMDLDRTVANLLTELEKRGKADNTSILLFSDHNAYYYNMCYNMKGVDKSDYSNTYVHNVPLILYSPHLTEKTGGFEVDTFCNTYDVLPTLCDLFGLPSNTNLYHGYSIFSDEIENSFFSSNLNGMFADGIFSMNISDVTILSDDVTDEDIEKFRENANKFYRKQEYLEDIYKFGINGTRALA